MASADSRSAGGKEPKRLKALFPGRRWTLHPRGLWHGVLRSLGLTGPLHQRFERLVFAVKRAVCRLPLAQKSLPGCRGTALALQPADSWPGDAERGRDLLRGRYRFAGRSITDPSPLWEPVAAGEDWLAALHGFDWLRDLRTTGGDPARRLARSLADDWLEKHGQHWTALSWHPAVLARRLDACLTHYEYFAASAEPALQQELIDSLGRQALFLRRVLPAGLSGFELLAAIKALLMASFCLPGGDTLRTRGEALLVRELRRQVGVDGGQIERNPSLLAALLQHLIDLRALYSVADKEAPVALEQALLRSAPLLKLLRHGDGTLALFNGSHEGEAWYFDLLLQRAGVRGRPFEAAPEAGFQRLQAGRSLLLVDSGPPPPPGFDAEAHAGTLSFEMSVGREHLIVNCGSLLGHSDWAALLRGTAAHSTLSIGDLNSSEVFPGGGLGRRVGKVLCRREAAEGHSWLEMSHDGYGERLGLLHHRRLYLASGGDDLRGEERIERLPGREARSEGQEAVLRFHLHPEVKATLLQGGSVLLRLKRGGGWRFRQASGSVRLEPSLYCGPGEGQPRQSEQIIVTAPLAGRDTVIKWSLKREQTAP